MPISQNETPQPTTPAEPVVFEEPQAGGCYVRNPRTGALSPAPLNFQESQE